MMKQLFATLLLLSSLSTNLYSQQRRIAMIQSDFVWGDTAANIAAFDEKISVIEGCDLIIMPELFTSGCDMQRREKAIKDAAKRDIAAIYPQVVEQMLRWAAKSEAVVIGSTIYEQDSLFYNRLIAAYPNGEYDIYDKHNCFKMGSFASGEEHQVININGHRYATYICYDLRFAEWSENNGRYDTAIYIANWPESRSEDWSALLSQRAKENRTYVIGVNCVGKDSSGVNFMGDSSLYAPDGSLQAKCDRDKVQTLIVEY